MEKDVKYKRGKAYDKDMRRFHCFRSDCGRLLFFAKQLDRENKHSVSLSIKCPDCGIFNKIKI